MKTSMKFSLGLSQLRSCSLWPGAWRCRSRTFPGQHWRPSTPTALLDTWTCPDGVRVHYRDQGKPGGLPLVMVHGFSASLHAWEP